MIFFCLEHEFQKENYQMSNPSLRVVPPVPDPSILDFVILRVFTLCFLFFAVGFVFASVATKVAP